MALKASARRQQKTAKKETAVTRLAEYDLPEDVINSALAFADRFG